MTNISSINHANFARLHELTNNYNKATLLDKLVFWWQISTYTLDDGKIWFTRGLNQIAEDSKIPKRSVERYLHDFEAAGLIEKTNKLYKKKNLYIRITEKLLVLIGKSDEFQSNNEAEQTKKSTIDKENKTSDSLFLNHFGDTDIAKMAVSIYKDKDSNSIINNTVSQTNNVNNSKNNMSNNNKNKLYPNYPIEKKIGERLSERYKNYIKGMMHNLQTQYYLVFSNPEQLFAEIVFSLLQTNNQFPGIVDNHHRINLIAKLLRQKKWRTPKGFYNHWDVGQTYRAQLEKREQNDRFIKLEETGMLNEPDEVLNQKNYSYGFNRVKSAVKYQPVNSELRTLKSKHHEISMLISSETRYLKDLESHHLKKPNDMMMRLINNTATKIATLYDELSCIDEQIYSKSVA